MTSRTGREEEIRMEREKETKDDGRYIIFYTFANEEKEES